MPWHYNTDRGSDGTVHVWPCDDVRPHVSEGGDPCWCAPDAEFHVGAVLVTHRDLLDREVSS